MTLYVKRRIPVEAIQVLPDNHDEVLKFVGTYDSSDKVGDSIEEPYVRFGNSQHAHSVLDRLHDAWIPFEYGDWIIRGVQGELYPHKGDLFPQVYEEYTDEADRT